MKVLHFGINIQIHQSQNQKRWLPMRTHNEIKSNVTASKSSLENIDKNLCWKQRKKCLGPSNHTDKTLQHAAKITRLPTIQCAQPWQSQTAKLQTFGIKVTTWRSITMPNQCWPRLTRNRDKEKIKRMTKRYDWNVHRNHTNFRADENTYPSNDHLSWSHFRDWCILQKALSSKTGLRYIHRHVAEYAVTVASRSQSL